jgi:hypothetical protein
MGWRDMSSGVNFTASFPRTGPDANFRIKVKESAVAGISSAGPEIMKRSKILKSVSVPSGSRMCLSQIDATCKNGRISNGFSVTSTSRENCRTIFGQRASWL